MIVQMGDKYTTRDGQPVRILCVDGPDDMFPVVYMLNDSRVFRTQFDGTFGAASSLSHYDLIEVRPYADYVLDERVLVRAEGDVFWTRRHFAGIDSNGKAKVWEDSKTSWTANGRARTWDECRRAAVEELGEMK